MINTVEYKSFADVTNNLFHTRFVEKGFGVSKWHVYKNNVSYYQANTHTLSLYLAGGNKSYRNDNKSIRGGPDKICFMPQNQDSLWNINEKIEFIHVYFTDDYLKLFASLNLDIDIRSLNVREIVYDNNPEIKANIVGLYQLSCQDSKLDLMAKEEWQMQLMHSVISYYNETKIKEENIKGGLCSDSLKTLKQAIFDDVSASHSVASLANLVNLSPFHFAKMFKISVGLSPAQYILQCRLLTAKRLLKTSDSLTDISYLSGFSHQSHMTSVFKKYLGVTPSFYRSSL